MEKITFSFGQNWLDYLSAADSDAVLYAQRDIKQKILEATGEREYNFQEKTVLDIGCGSGIHSLAFYLLGVKQIYSFDYDPKSVQAANSLREKVGAPENWSVTQGSILDEGYVNSLPCSDIVYSWGSLHHTGDMWRALDNASQRLNKGGLWFLSLYQGVDTYKKDLRLKTMYNKMPVVGKKLMEGYQILKAMARCALRKENPLKWNKTKERGMSVYYDIVDWLGGLPYEVASPDEIKRYGETTGGGLSLKLCDPKDACCVYIFEK
ncbi:MAG: class I SAM-dependent methyltransferase [Helicobacteraceae bacterium]|jgi:2-polyprenyl-6-hydroxyphenyl methylase/3-demethylubiquinone-9 3-methyltransferase|nr:class I SAM-dependent methyltransferase [Helicobacteraceae bacterium]